MTKRELTSTGERRIIPNFVIPGGIARVTRMKRTRNGLRIYYVHENDKHGRTGEGWMLHSEWSRLRRSHKK